MAGEADNEAEILPSQMKLSLARTLSEQAEKLAVEAHGLDGFHKPVADGVAAIAKAAGSLADLVVATEERRATQNDDELINVRGFFAAADERIDELARQRAARMVAEQALAVCPACGASLRPAGDA